MNIDIYTPDQFLQLLYQLSPETVIQAFQNQLASLKNPPKTKEELIAILVNCKLDSAEAIFK